MHGLCVYGGPGGIRTPVQNPFLSTSYSLNLQYIFILICCQVNLVLSTRIELVFHPYQGCVMPLYYESMLEQDTRIELVTGRWQRSVLPLN